MSFLVSCPHCRHKFQVPDAFDGRKGKCPQCQEVFRAVKGAENGGVIARTAANLTSNANASDVSSKPTRELTSPKADTVSAPLGTKKVIPKPRVLSARASEVSVPPTTSEAVAGPSATGAPPKPTAKPKPVAASPSSLNDSKTEDVPTAVSSPAFLADTKIAAKGPASSGRHAAVVHRQKKSNTTSIIAIAVLLLLLVGSVGGFTAWSMLSNDDAPIVAASDDELKEKATGLVAPPVSRPTASSGETPEEKIEPDASPASAAVTNKWAEFQPSIVQIDIESNAGTNSGAGFLIDSRGWVLTSARLLNNAFGAISIHADGSRSEVKGVVARYPDLGLVVLKLDEVMAEVKPLVIADAKRPYKRMLVFAASKDEAKPGVIRKISATDMLPPIVRSNIPDRARNNPESAWIEHSMKVLADQEGTPLLAADGRVVGVNFSFDDELRYGYAVSIESLSSLLANASDEELEPLAGEGIAKNDAAIPDFPAEVPAPVEPMAENALQKYQRLVKECAEFSWVPKDATQYAKCQEFARATYIALDPALINGIDESLRADYLAAAEAALETVAESPWPNIDAMATVNRLAVDSLAGDETGFFGYARTQMRPGENFAATPFEGKPMFGFQLIGSEQFVLVPISKSGDELPLESEWLIIGARVPGAVATLGRPEGELQAYLIKSQVFIGKPE